MRRLSIVFHDTVTTWRWYRVAAIIEINGLRWVGGGHLFRDARS
jgi:hypothetical protein